MRISDWSSDVCSSDLQYARLHDARQRLFRAIACTGAESQARQGLPVRLDTRGCLDQTQRARLISVCPVAPRRTKLGGALDCETRARVRPEARTRVVAGKAWSVRVDLVGRRTQK